MVFDWMAKTFLTSPVRLRVGFLLILLSFLLKRNQITDVLPLIIDSG